MFFRIKKEWKDIDLPVNVIFQSQTLDALAGEIDRALDPIDLRLDTMPLPRDDSVEHEAYAADTRNLVHRLPPSIPTIQTGSNSEGVSTGSTVLLTAPQAS
jgi:L-aminoadipate-semialdehyde dehydrogenase